MHIMGIAKRKTFGDDINIRGDKRHNIDLLMNIPSWVLQTKICAVQSCCDNRLLGEKARAFSYYKFWDIRIIILCLWGFHDVNLRRDVKVR